MAGVPGHITASEANVTIKTLFIGHFKIWGGETTQEVIYHVFNWSIPTPLHVTSVHSQYQHSNQEIKCFNVKLIKPKGMLQKKSQRKWTLTFPLTMKSLTSSIYYIIFSVSHLL